MRYNTISARVKILSFAVSLFKRMTSGSLQDTVSRQVSSFFLILSLFQTRISTSLPPLAGTADRVTHPRAAALLSILTRLRRPLQICLYAVHFFGLSLPLSWFSVRRHCHAKRRQKRGVGRTEAWGPARLATARVRGRVLERGLVAPAPAPRRHREEGDGESSRKLQSTRMLQT